MSEDQSKPVTVYAVTAGEYSDYRVKALFTTEALAERHLKDSGDAVEEFLLFDRLPNRVTIYSIDARIWPNGHVTAETYRYDYKPHEEPSIRERVEWEYGGYDGAARPIMEARTFQAPYAGDDWLVRVSGTDKKRVLKAFRDRVAQARARTLGVEA